LAEQEHDLAGLAGIERQLDVERGAGIEAGAEATS
jgi:hypothetical protein